MLLKSIFTIYIFYDKMNKDGIDSPYLLLYQSYFPIYLNQKLISGFWRKYKREEKVPRYDAPGRSNVVIIYVNYWSGLWKNNESV